MFQLGEEAHLYCHLFSAYQSIFIVGTTLFRRVNTAALRLGRDFLAVGGLLVM